MNGSRAVEQVRVTPGDTQVVSQVGLHLLGKLADASGLTCAYSSAVPITGERAPMHDRGRVLAHLAVMLAGGGDCISDLAALRDQPDLFGEVASGPTAGRVLHGIDTAVLAAMRTARAEARAKVWSAGGAPEEIIFDIDAALVEIHSENKEGATSHYKSGFGFQPMFCFLDATGEAMAGLLRAGNAAANSGADQLAVVDLAIAQLPDAHGAEHRAGDDPGQVNHPILVRADSAGAVHELIDGLVARNVEFSVGGRVNDCLDKAIRAVPAKAWRKAVGHNGEERHAGEVAELDVVLSGWPDGTRTICRREKPHPGAQLKLWDHDGYRHQVVLTNSAGDALVLEARHRAHARVENSIKALRDTGLDRMPFTAFAANAAWLDLVLAGADLLAWLRMRCLDGALAQATPKTLRYRLLHGAARLLRRARIVVLRLPERWPWAAELATAYRRVALIDT